MCDYSLELYRSVPAAVGESYKLVRFGTGSMGFAAGTSCDTAACVPAGAHLRLDGIDQALQQTLGIGPVEEVVMTRLEGGLHKDAVRFANGREISLQSLNPGLSATMFVPLPDLGLDRLHEVADEIAESDELIDA
jgi:hypothetical protein